MQARSPHFPRGSMNNSCGDAGGTGDVAGRGTGDPGGGGLGDLGGTERVLGGGIGDYVPAQGLFGDSGDTLGRLERAEE